MTTLSNKIVRIRKSQLCFSCHRRFPSGTSMNYWAGIYEGLFNTSYSCMTCVDIMNMRQDPDEEGFPDGYVNEMLEKGQTPEELLNTLTN